MLLVRLVVIGCGCRCCRCGRRRRRQVEVGGVVGGGDTRSKGRMSRLRGRTRIGERTLGQRACGGRCGRHRRGRHAAAAAATVHRIDHLLLLLLLLLLFTVDIAAAAAQHCAPLEQLAPLFHLGCRLGLSCHRRLHAIRVVVVVVVALAVLMLSHCVGVALAHLAVGAAVGLRALARVVLAYERVVQLVRLVVLVLEVARCGVLDAAFVLLLLLLLLLFSDLLLLLLCLCCSTLLFGKDVLAVFVEVVARRLGPDLRERRRLAHLAALLSGHVAGDGRCGRVDVVDGYHLHVDLPYGVGHVAVVALTGRVDHVAREVGVGALLVPLQVVLGRLGTLHLIGSIGHRLALDLS